MNDLLYEAQLILDRAEDTLEDAKLLLESDRILAATNRTY